MSTKYTSQTASIQAFGLVLKALQYEDLPSFERFANWHYDLEINLPGLEVIHDMLRKMEDLKQKNRELMNKLSAISDKYEEGSV